MNDASPGVVQRQFLVFQQPLALVVANRLGFLLPRELDGRGRVLGQFVPQVEVEARSCEQFRQVRCRHVLDAELVAPRVSQDGRSVEEADAHLPTSIVPTNQDRQAEPALAFDDPRGGEVTTNSVVSSAFLACHAGHEEDGPDDAEAQPLPLVRRHADRRPQYVCGHVLPGLAVVQEDVELLLGCQHRCFSLQCRCLFSPHPLLVLGLFPLGLRLPLVELLLVAELFIELGLPGRLVREGPKELVRRRRLTRPPGLVVHGVQLRVERAECHARLVEYCASSRQLSALTGCTLVARLVVRAQASPGFHAVPDVARQVGPGGEEVSRVGWHLEVSVVVATLHPTDPTVVAVVVAAVVVGLVDHGELLGIPLVDAADDPVVIGQPVSYDLDRCCGHGISNERTKDPHSSNKNFQKEDDGESEADMLFHG